MKLFLYSHGGSGNHGCEAIVRGTDKLIGHGRFTLYSNNTDEDVKYGLNKIVKLEKSRTNYSKFNIKRILASLRIRLFKDETYATKVSIDHILNSYGKSDIAISIGGDNYCYPGFEEFGVINNMIREKGIKNVLWGCSVEPSMINDTMSSDLKGYNLIVARESITYEALSKVNDNVVLYPDPAFYMDKCNMNLVFDNNNKTVGINVSPHIMTCENLKGIVYQNYKELIMYLIENTDYNVLLVPHVFWPTNNDKNVLDKLYKDFDCNERIVVVGDHTAPELKGIISQCDMFIGARTHSTIAAYSTCVPTLVVGYSVKARGIAKDLFGTEENYVISAQSLKEVDDLKNSFKWLDENHEDIKRYLDNKIPQYLSSNLDIEDNVLSLVKGKNQ